MKEKYVFAINKMDKDALMIHAFVDNGDNKLDRFDINHDGVVWSERTDERPIEGSTVLKIDWGSVGEVVNVLYRAVPVLKEALDNGKLAYMDNPPHGFEMEVLVNKEWFDEAFDILQCIAMFDDMEESDVKAEYFDVVQKDVIKLLERVQK